MTPTRNKASEKLAVATEKGPPGPAAKPSRRHPAFGAMKGTFTIAPGVDLTEPAMPEWADLIDAKYSKQP